MDAGQTFFAAWAGVDHERAYVSISKHESIGSVAGVVAFRRYNGEVDSYPEADVYPTEAEAKAACVRKLRERKQRIVDSIDAEITKLEGQS